MAQLRGTPGDDGSYTGKLRKFYGVGGGNSYPAPGSNGPAQMLYDHHQNYGNAHDPSIVEGSDSWPGSANPTTAKVVR